MSVVCCQVKVSATGQPLFQRCPTECGVSKAVITRGYCTSQRVQSPASERAAGELAMPITRGNQKAGRSTFSALDHHSTSHR